MVNTRSGLSVNFPSSENPSEYTSTESTSTPVMALLQTQAIPFLPNKFSKKDPEIWFQQLEAVFTLNNVTDDDQKLAYAQANLDTETLAQVRTRTKELPTEEKYNYFKKQIISEFSESVSDAIRKLLKGMSLGDRKPSALLREMRAQAREQVNDEVLRNLFLERLPADVRFVLAGNVEKLETLAERADRMLESQGHLYQVSAIQPQIATNLPPLFLPPAHVDAIRSTSTVSDLQAQINALNDGIKQILGQVTTLNEKYNTLSAYIQFTPNTFVRNSRPRDQTPNFPRRTRSPSPFSVPDGLQICFYYYRFGNLARKCKNTLSNGKPCLHAPNSQPGN